MAPCGRSRLLLPLTLLCLCGSGSVLGAKAASRAAEPPNQAAHRGAESAKDAPAAAAAAAGASAPRRATGWKLAEEEACREDLSRLCPRHTWANNLAVLECLQDRREVRAQPAEPGRFTPVLCGGVGVVGEAGCVGVGSDPHRLGEDGEVNLPTHTHTHTLTQRKDRNMTRCK